MYTGKNVALIFEKTSTRTRCSFEVAAHDMGIGTTYLEPDSSQIGKKESIADTARILSGYVDAIMQKKADGNRFSFADVTVDAAAFQIEGSAIHLTSKEIDLLRALGDGPLADVRHLSTYVNALNNKLATLRSTSDYFAEAWILKI